MHEYAGAKPANRIIILITRRHTTVTTLYTTTSPFSSKPHTYTQQKYVIITLQDYV